MSKLLPDLLVRTQIAGDIGEGQDLVANGGERQKPRKHGEERQNLIEYALLVCLIALIAISSGGNMISAVSKVFASVSASIS